MAFFYAQILCPKRGAIMSTLQITKPSKYKALLKEYSIPISQLSGHLGLSYSYTIRLINGYERISADVAKGINDFIELYKIEMHGKMSQLFGSIGRNRNKPVR